jgi:phosphate acetyltransferase
VNIRQHILKLINKNKKKKKIIMPECFDVRILRAAEKLVKDEIASVVLPTNSIENVKKNAHELKIDLNCIEIVKIDTEILNKDKIDEFVNARLRRGTITKKEAFNLLKNPLYFSMMYLKSGNCDACVCGAVYNTADVLRAAIHVVGIAKNVKIVSSYFLMIPPDLHNFINEPVMFADCAVIPNPQAADLKDIAVSTVENFKKIFPNRQANIAMLSFSTKGSSNNKDLQKVFEATNLLKSHFAKYDSNVNVDGELQFDAAVVPSIGARKAPNSLVAGKANILIFPDLNAGNIGYKIAERYGGFQAIGPVIQGLSLPVSDLSRGSDFDAIYLISTVIIID